MTSSTLAAREPVRPGHSPAARRGDRRARRPARRARKATDAADRHAQVAAGQRQRRVARASTSRAIFSEAIQPATLSFVLRNSLNQVVSSQVTYDDGTRTATLNPNSALAGSQTFTATVSGARDLAGNLMAQVNWSFTTSTDGFQDTVLPQTRPDATHRHPVRPERPRLRRREERPHLRSTTSTTRRPRPGRRPARERLQLLGPRPARDGPRPELPGHPVHLRALHLRRVPGRPRAAVGRRSSSDACPDPPGADHQRLCRDRPLEPPRHRPGNWPLGPGDEVLVTDWFQQFPSHSVGSLVFGPDGALYASGGDGASFDFADYGQILVDPERRRPAERRRRAAQPGHPDQRRPRDARRDDHPHRSGDRRRAARQSALRVERRQRQAHRHLRPAQPVPRHLPPRDQRVVGRRRRLEHLGGDQPHRRSARRDDRELRLAVLRGQCPPARLRRPRPAAVRVPLRRGSGAVVRPLLHLQPRRPGRARRSLSPRHPGGPLPRSRAWPSTRPAAARIPAPTTARSSSPTTRATACGR